jgi:protein-disulfide isomerase
MSKRQEIRDRRRREKTRNRIIVIGIILIGALFITYAIISGVRTAQSASATQDAANGDPIQVTPRAYTAQVNGTSMGDPNAPVKLVAYEDFRCSSCLYYTQNIEPGIITNYVETGKVYYTYKVFIVIDGNDGSDASNRAANAALCAAEQNKFWEYHDILYANQVTESAQWFTDPRLVKMAQDVGLDMTKFNQCFSSHKYQTQITQDQLAAQKLGVTGTPSFTINGKLISYNQQTDIINQINAAVSGK